MVGHENGGGSSGVLQPSGVAWGRRKFEKHLTMVCEVQIFIWKVMEGTKCVNEYLFRSTAVGQLQDDPTNFLLRRTLIIPWDDIFKGKNHPNLMIARLCFRATRNPTKNNLREAARWLFLATPSKYNVAPFPVY